MYSIFCHSFFFFFNNRKENIFLFTERERWFWQKFWLTKKRKRRGHIVQQHPKRIAQAMLLVWCSTSKWRLQSVFFSPILFCGLYFSIHSRCHYHSELKQCWVTFCYSLQSQKPLQISLVLDLEVSTHFKFECCSALSPLTNRKIYSIILFIFNKYSLILERYYYTLLT